MNAEQAASKEKRQLAPWENAVVGAKRLFNEIALADGGLVLYKKEALFAMQSIQKSEWLQSSDPRSIRNAVINVASIGLTLNPASAYAYLVPRDGKACLDISYKGLIKLATDSGSVMWVKAILVYESDEFEMRGIDEMPKHKYDPFRKDRGDITGGYCAAKLHDGSYMIDTMSIEELDQVQETSKAKNGPWKTWPKEMQKKTLIKRASKTWPNTKRLDTAVEIINAHEGLEDKYIDGTANQVDSSETVDAEHVLFVANAIKGWIDDDVEDADKAFELRELTKDLSMDEYNRVQAMLKEKAPDSGPRGKMYSSLLKEYLNQ